MNTLSYGGVNDQGSGSVDTSYFPTHYHKQEYMYKAVY